MPHYEIKVTCTKRICVEAEDEDTALEIAEEETSFGWDVCDADSMEEYDPADPATDVLIEGYKKAGDYYSG